MFTTRSKHTTRTAYRLTSAVAVAGVSLLAAGPLAQADTVVWEGADADWFTGSNWDASAIPGSADDIVFDGSGVNTVDTSTPGVGELSEGSTLTFTADQTAGLTIQSDHVDRRVRLYTGGSQNLGNDAMLTVEAGSGAHTIERLGYGADSVNQDWSRIVNNGGTLTINHLTNNAGGTRGVEFDGSGTTVVTDTIGGSKFHVSGGTLDMQANPSTNVGWSTDAGTVLTNTSGTTRRIRNNGDTTFAGEISGNLFYERGRNNFNDNNFTTMLADNTYAGVTNVNTGTLLVNGSHVGGDNYTVTASVINNNEGRTGGGTLGGTGSIDIGGNTVSVSAPLEQGTSGQPWATIAPGAGDDTETLTLTAASVTFGDFGQFSVEVDAAGLSDLLAINGDLNLSSTLNRLNVSDLGSAFDGSIYTLLTYTGSRTGEFSDVLGLDGTGYSVYYNDAAGSIQLVPEPASLVLLGAGGLLMLRRRSGRQVA
ncbi:MAG: PEP-CTERM sorting domain-containing protein [Phycisphaeraceae bacterium]